MMTKPRIFTRKYGGPHSNNWLSIGFKAGDPAFVQGEYPKTSLRYYMLMIFTAATTGFANGYNLSYLTLIKYIITMWIRSLNSPHFQTPDELEQIYVHISSIYCLGGICGGVMTGFISHYTGRKNGLVASNWIGIAGASLSASTIALGSPFVLMAGRFILGINGGLNMGIGTIYLIECSPTQHRGMISSLFHTFIALSAVFGQILGGPHVLGTQNLWIYLFIPSVFVASLQLIALFFLPESPIYLLKKKSEESSIRALHKLHGNRDISKYFEELKAEVSQSKGNVTFNQFFMDRINRKALYLSAFMTFSVQFSGVVAILSYSRQIFEQMQLDPTLLGNLISGVGSAFFLGNLMNLILIDRVDRKHLLGISFLGMITSCILATVFFSYTDDLIWAIYLSVASIYSATVFHSFGIGPLPSLIANEMLFSNARPIASSINIPLKWILHYAIMLMFPYALIAIRYRVLFFFIAIQCISILIITLFLPETRGKSIADIRHSM